MRTIILLMAVCTVHGQTVASGDSVGVSQAALDLKADKANPTFSGNLTIDTTVLGPKQGIDVLCSGNVTTTLQAAINAQAALGGGTVRVSAGACYSTAQVTLPNDGLTQPHQVPITLRGAGSAWDGSWLSSTVGATVLDLRATTAPAKIDTRGLGLLTIEDIAFANTTAADSTPFVQTTNTTLHIRHNSFTGSGAGGSASISDAIVLGGTTTTSDGSATAAFQGYGTIVEGNYFGKIRRGVYGRVWANAVVIRDNTWANNCGADNTAAALEIDGTVGFAQNNVIQNNLVEMGGYVYGFTFRNSAQNLLIANTFWDGPSSLAAIRLTGVAGHASNSCIFCILPAVPKAWVDDAGGNLFTNFANGTVFGNTALTFLSGAVIQPEPPPGDENKKLWIIKRSSVDPTNPNGEVFTLDQGGHFQLYGTAASPNANFSVKNGSAQITYDHQSIVKNTGNLELYPGNTNTALVRIPRGVLQISSYATTGRGSASTVGVGAMYYDTTLSLPLWSDGTNWRDAAGTIR